MDEIWKPVLGFEGLYEVSNLGRVRADIRGGRKGSKPGRIMVATHDDKGYPHIGLARKGRYKTMKVHRMVAEAFLGERPPGFTVNHIDANKDNNAVSNLEYVSCKENVWHAHRVIPTRASVVINGERMSMPEANARFGIGVGDKTVRSRIAGGWTIEEAISTPVIQTGRHRNVAPRQEQS